MARDVFWFVIHLTFYLFGQHIGPSDNLLALSWKADTNYFLSLQSCQSKPDNVTLHIKLAQNPLILHSFPLISSSDLISLGLGMSSRELSLHLQDS